MMPYAISVYKTELTIVATASTMGSGPPECGLPESNIPMTIPGNPSAAKGATSEEVMPNFRRNVYVTRKNAKLIIKEAKAPITIASRQLCVSVSVPLISCTSGDPPFRPVLAKDGALEFFLTSALHSGNDS